MKINDFYRVDGKTRIIDRMCAIFGIKDQSRVKIVSIYTGSIKVTLMVNTPVISEDKSTSADYAQGLADIKVLKAVIDSALESGDLGDQLLNKD